MDATERPEQHRSSSATPRTPWRTVDIVVAAMLGVVFGVIFWIWNTFLYTPISAPLDGSPLQPLVAGLWVLPGVVGGLVLRRVGAAFFTELVAATVSMLFGSAWGLSVFLSGLVQALGAELGFALFGYRRWTLPVALVAGALTGAAMGVYEAFVFNAEFSLGAQLVYVGSAVTTGVVIAGIGGYALTRALASTGVLDPFASGRARTEV